MIDKKAFAAWAAERKRVLTKLIAKQHKQRNELGRGLARLEALQKQLDSLQSGLPEARSGRAGRPGKWRGVDGHALYQIVTSQREATGHSIAHVVRSLHAGGAFRDYSGRELQKKYQEAARFWEPKYRRLEEIESAIAKELSRLARLGLVMTTEEVKNFIRTVPKKRR